MSPTSAQTAAPVSKPVLDPMTRRMRIFRAREIELVLDVGANRGQYGAWLRSAGFQGRIVSFEPLRAPFAGLANAARGDAGWECHRIALGAMPAHARAMNVSADSVSSSMLSLHHRTLALEPETACAATEHVDVTTLDDFVPRLQLSRARTSLKIDVQGYELEVLRGSRRSLERMSVIETEVSLVHSYVGQALLSEIVGFLDERHFHLVSLEPVSDDPASGQMLQLDAIFARDGGW
jgi:FkbM family methyltransferase